MRHIFLPLALTATLGAGGTLAQQAEPPVEEAESTGDAAQVIEPENTQAEAGAGGATEEVAEGEVTVIEAETAEPTEGSEAETSEAVAAPEEVIAREQAPNELLVDWITDTTVRSPDGEVIGEVDDLILDKETGQLTGAVLGVGGFLGIGEKKIAVNWAELQIDYDANEISMDLTRDEADAAPKYIFRSQEPAPAPAAGAGMGNATGTATGGMAPVEPAQ